MDFDYIAFWVLKEDLMPFLGESCAIIGARYALVVQKGHEGCDIAGSNDVDMYGLSRHFV